MNLKLKPGDSVNFTEWHWGTFELDKLISDRVTEVLTDELSKDPPYVVISDGFPAQEPLSITVGWPFSDDAFFGCELRAALLEFVEEFRPGGVGSGLRVDDQRVFDAANQLRAIADEMEALARAGEP